MVDYELTKLVVMVVTIEVLSLRGQVVITIEHFSVNKEYNWVNWFFSKYVEKLVEKNKGALRALNIQVKNTEPVSTVSLKGSLISYSWGDGIFEKKIQSLIMHVVEL